MKWKHLIALLLVCIFGCAPTFAHDQPDKPVETTLCDIVKAPQEFKGKRIRIRAQFWWGRQNSWMSEAGSLQIGKVCGWLPTDFDYPTSLVGAIAFGTFTGRLIFVPTYRMGRLRSCVRFMVEEQSDIDDQGTLNGLITKPWLYDRNKGTFVRPESCLLL